MTEAIPQIVTASATLIGIALTLFFNGRREAARMREQFRFEREKILAADRLKVVLQTAHTLQRIRELFADRDDVLYGNGTHDVPAWEASLQDNLDSLFLLETELRVLAPELASYVRDATRQARFVRDMKLDLARDRMEEEAGVIVKYTSCVHEAMDQMQKLFRTATSDEADPSPVTRRIGRRRRLSRFGI